LPPGPSTATSPCRRSAGARRTTSAPCAARPARTTLSLGAEHRELGTTHAVTLSHRFARTAILFSDSRAVTPPENRAARGILGTEFDVRMLKYAGITDLDARRDKVVGELAREGIDPDQPFVADLFTSSVSLDRRQDLALSWIGLRDTVTLGFSRSDQRRIDTLFVPT
jgi:uncharacterized protein (PEP-CTERM system associated)